VAPQSGVGGQRYRPGMGLVISNLAVDCTEPRALAAWWAEALGWQIVEDPQADADDDEVGIAPAGLQPPC